MTAEYSNQAEAQRAADTRDTDGDGIYCESLPCPCLRPGGNPPPPPPPVAPKPKPKPKPKAGAGTKATKPVRRGRARIVEVVSTTVVKVRIARAGRSRGLHAEERVRLIGADAPRAGECAGAEARAALLRYAFGDEARDTNADGLVDEEPLDPLSRGAVVDLRTDPKLRDRDDAGQLRAYLFDAGTELAERYVRSGWAAFRSTDAKASRAARLLDAETAAQRDGRGAWLLCHASFHRPDNERFSGFAWCDRGVDTDGSIADAGGFMRFIVVRGFDCDEGYGVVGRWAVETFGGGGGPPTRIDELTCVNEDVGRENPAIEAMCRAPDGRAVAFFAAP